MPLAVFLLCCGIWSTTYFAIRVSLRGYPPLTGAALRFALAAGLVLVLVRLWPRLLAPAPAPGDASPGAGETTAPVGPTPAERRRAAWAIAAAAALNALAYALTYYAETRMTGGTAAVLAAASPLSTLVVVQLLRMEAVRADRVAGVLLGTAGMVLLFYEGAVRGLTGARAPGLLTAMAAMVLAATLLWPGYNVLLKRYAGYLDPLRLNLRFLTWTALFLAAAALIADRHVPLASLGGLRPTAAVVYLAVMGTVVAWTGYMWMLKRLELSTLSTMVFVQPLLALLVDVVMGDERLSLRAYGGAALVLAGVLIAALRTPRGAGA